MTDPRFAKRRGYMNEMLVRGKAAAENQQQTDTTRVGTGTSPTGRIADADADRLREQQFPTPEDFRTPVRTEAEDVYRDQEFYGEGNKRPGRQNSSI